MKAAAENLIHLNLFLVLLSNDDLGVGKGVAMSHLPETWPAQWPDYPDWTYSGDPIIIDGIDKTPSS